MELASEQCYFGDGGFGNHRPRGYGNGPWLRDYYESYLQYSLLMSQNIEKQWYVLKAIGGKEKKVAEAIEAEIRNLKLQDYIAQVLVPTEKVYSVRGGKKVTKERISYPGYVLVQAALVGEIPYILRNTPNVMGFLSDTKTASMQATPLREDEVNRLLGRVDELAESEAEAEVPFVVGETVKVVEGPFASFYGAIDEIDEARKKLVVSVKIFGRKTPMELNRV